MSRYDRTAPRHDLPSPAQTITDAIIARLEAGVRPWKKPWTGAPPLRPLRVCGTPYRGINVFWLWLMADMLGYASPFWMTYNQAQALGGQVRRGERSTVAVFYKAYGKQVADEATGESRDETRRVLRQYAVFNAGQIDGLPDRFHPVAPTRTFGGDDRERLAEIDSFFTPLGADVRHGGDRAYYARVGDFIQLPDPAAFDTVDLYGATKAHEYIHWSGAEHRLGRTFGERFGDNAYAAEELVAELGSAILGAELGLPVDHLDEHAAYLGHWLGMLRADPKALLTIASKADEAATYILTAGGRPPAGTAAISTPTNDAVALDMALAA